MNILGLFKRRDDRREQPMEHNQSNKYVNWSYRSIPMTLELSRRKDEEELIEMFQAHKPKKAVFINRGERNV